MNTAIVALPPKDDRVAKLSSEKVAHLTLLNLGDVSLSEDAILYVKHASSELSPFGLSVDYRGELGDKDADVLFFETNAWDTGRVKEFMHYLLLNDEIKRAFDAAPQFPEWTPHLTLGYPETPANEDEVDYPVRYVDFGAIAVWTEAYDGPEFRLKYDDLMSDSSAAWGDMSASDKGAYAAAVMFGDENALKQFGVKGMRWGVRKNDSGGGNSSAPKQRGKIKRALTKVDVATDAGAKIINEGEKKLIFLPHKNRADAASNTQVRMLAAAKRVNNDSQFKGKDIKHDAPLKKKYFDALQEEAKTIYAEELNISRVEAWGEVLQIDTSSVTQQMRVSAAVDKIVHADSDVEVLLVMDLVTDDDGFVTDISVPDNYLKQDAFEDNELTVVHYGVKGMKWGVRNDRGHEGERVKTKKLDKLDKKWEKDEAKNWWQAHNAAADKMNNGEIDRINNKPEWVKAADEGKFDDWDNPTPELQAYMKDHEDTFNRHYAEALVARGSNPSGTKRYELVTDDEGGVYAELREVKHAEEGAQDVRHKITLNDKGMITKFTPEEVELKHYGVKGMRWGVRKDDSTSRGGADKGPTAVVVTQKKPGKFAKTEGGQRQPLHEDAVRALEARQKASASTTDSLSNAELRAAVDRMQLEQRYNDLSFSSDRRSKGARFVAGLLGKKRYTGEKRKYTDEMEDVGEQTRNAVKAAMEAREKANAA